MRTQAHLRLKLDAIVPESSLAPLPAPLVLAPLRLLRRSLVKVWHVVVVAKGIAARAHATVMMFVVLVVMMVCAPWVCPLAGVVVMVTRRIAALTTTAGARPRTVLVRFPSLLALLAPPSAPVEARRGPSEGASPPAQTARRPAPRGTVVRTLC